MKMMRSKKHDDNNEEQQDANHVDQHPFIIPIAPMTDLPIIVLVVACTAPQAKYVIRSKKISLS